MNGHSPGLNVADLTVSFQDTPVVYRFGLTARPGTITGVAGESGSGKTTAVLTAIGYTPPGATRDGGEAQLGEASIFSLNRTSLRALWAHTISYVPQDAVGSLNPSRRIGSVLREVLTVNAHLPNAEANQRAAELLASMQIADPRATLRKYPHELSGGQAQRVALACALASDPALLVLDEPTTGLDVTTQAEVLRTIRRAITRRRTAAIYISHDLGLLASVAADLVIVYAGEVVEAGPTHQLLNSPRHPYTRALIDALPSLSDKRKPHSISGLPPGHAVEESCAFASRCSWRIARCSETHPQLALVADSGTLARCIRQPDLGPLDSAVGPAYASEQRQPRPSPIVTVKHLSVEYRSGSTRTRAVDDVSLQVGPGEVVALVGESGSGKTTIGRAIAGIAGRITGAVAMDGRPLAIEARRRSPQQRRDIQIIFQNPDSSLNPRHSVGQLIGRSFQLFRPEISKQDLGAAIDAALREVQLDPGMRSRYPHQISGGQKQRVAIARALATRPRLLICDEIVSSQDVSVQAAIIDLLVSLQTSRSIALLFISHDLAVTRAIADYGYVLQSGSIVEEGTFGELLDHPSNPYTIRLVQSAIQTAGGDFTDKEQAGESSQVLQERNAN